MAVNKLDITMMEDVGTSASQLLQRDGSGNLPAVNASQVTGLSEFTTTTSDPATDTNPSGGVGTLWYNKTAGTMYVCTDATAGANVWINVGGGSGNIQALQFGGDGGGTLYGYRAMGYYPSVDAVIDRYSYASDGNAVGVTNATAAGYAGYGAQSQTHGYLVVGSVGWTASERVEKTTFASTTTQVNLGNLLRWVCIGGVATNSSTYLYELGSSLTTENGIQKMAFANEVEFSQVGDAYNAGLGTSDLGDGSGHASYTHGYRAGGNSNGPGSVQTDKIEKFTFAADANSTLVASLVRGIDTQMSGCSSLTHGYCLGGTSGAGQNEIDKFAFSTDSTSTDVGNLHTGGRAGAGTSSLTYGYMHGGGYPQINNIQKVSFTTDGNATDVGNLGAARAYVSGFHD